MRCFYFCKMIERKNDFRNTIALFDIDGTLRQARDPWMLLHKEFATEKEGIKYYDDWVQGKISYQEMSELDTQCWKGISKSNMLAPLQKNPIRKGAKELIDWLSKKQIRCYGISTGISLFNDVTAKELGLQEVISNDIIFENDICTGKIKINVEEGGKATILKHIKENCKADRIISFGDGPADIDLFAHSQLSFAVFPKTERIAAAADYCISSEPINSIIPIIDRFLIDK